MDTPLRPLVLLVDLPDVPAPDVEGAFVLQACAPDETLPSHAAAAVFSVDTLQRNPALLERVASETACVLVGSQWDAPRVGLAIRARAVSALPSPGDAQAFRDALEHAVFEHQRRVARRCLLHGCLEGAANRAWLAPLIHDVNGSLGTAWGNLSYVQDAARDLAAVAPEAAAEFHAAASDGITALGQARQAIQRARHAPPPPQPEGPPMALRAVLAAVGDLMGTLVTPAAVPDATWSATQVATWGPVLLALLANAADSALGIQRHHDAWQVQLDCAATAPPPSAAAELVSSLGGTLGHAAEGHRTRWTALLPDPP